MPGRGRVGAFLEAARLEALNAVEFYNRPLNRRPLESFLVHMHLAWTNLLYAEFQRAKIAYFYRDPERPSRYARVDGERRPWELDRCVRERWPQGDPVRENLELTMRLKDRIARRHEASLMVVATGFTQALVVNFEDELTEQFSERSSIAGEVHLPISLSTFSRDGLARLVAAQQSLPEQLRDWLVEYRAAIHDDVANDRRFEFRVEIVQKAAPVHDAELAVSFVREDDLSAEDRDAYRALERSGRIVLREKDRPVSGLGLYKPKALAALVEAEIPFRFGASSELAQAWKHFGVRPASSARGAARRRTDGRYCVYDEPHDDYMYTRAFAELLISSLATEAGFREVVGRAPRAKAPAASSVLAS